jgi:hypothetical protein
VSESPLFKGAFPYQQDVLALPVVDLDAASQDGAAILVSDIHRAKDEIEAAGVEIGNWRIDENDGEKRQVFFVVAPDGLCYYFYQPVSS